MKIIDYILGPSREKKRQEQLRREKERADLERHRMLRQQAIELNKDIIQTDKEIYELLEGLKDTIIENKKKKEAEESN